MSHEYQRPVAHEVSQGLEPLSKDSFEADTRLVAGTRKLIMVMFQLLKMPPIPSQEELDGYLAQVARDSEPPQTSL